MNGDVIAEAFNITDLFNSPLSPIQIVITLGAALLVGGFIFLIYKYTFGGVLYSRTFNLSLIMITMVTSLVLSLITTNLTMSLGMVGALSIIRFRTAVKDPMDTTFMFWAVAEGMALGAQYFDLALIGMVVIGLIMVLLTSFKFRSSMPYLLILHFHENANGSIKSALKQLPKNKVRSRTAQQNGIELTVEIRLRDEETAIVDKFLRIDGVYDASLIAHQGDMIS
ncbi:DUF4956 domain-containing protein [Christensenellaceae bacterium OttesenSCG-928-M15]|nr:DUF4956 domain-containing protein [Christensenellaceae bacterium OttesenSCG-928-M15]